MNLGRKKHWVFDENYINGIRGWVFSDEEIEEARKNNRMLMLDFELGEFCSLDCGYCFRRADVRDRGLKALNLSQTTDVIDQAADLGVKSIHIVGKGEPLEDPRFLRVIKYIHGKGIIPLVFTAGHIFGDDAKANMYHEMNGNQLAKNLYALDASIIVKINSLKPDISDKIVRTRGKYEYTKYRDIGLQRLIDIGFTKSNGKFLNPTRLGADILVLQDNYDEVFDMYVHCRDLNIYPLVVTFIPCGRTSERAQRKKYDVTDEQKMKLWKKLYHYNIKKAKIKYEGVSPFAGGHPCKQLRYALYVNVRGLVWSCPGEPDEWHLGSLVEPDKENLTEIWKNAPKNTNYLCISRIKCGSLPSRLKKKVEDYIQSLLAEES